MMETSGDLPANAGPVDNGGRRYQQVSAEDKRLIFVAVLSSMEKGVIKHGVFSSLSKKPWI
jgi:hypothetical protein